MNLGPADPGQEPGACALVLHLDVAVHGEVYRVDAAGVHVREGRRGPFHRDGEEVRVCPGHDIERFGSEPGENIGDGIPLSEHLDRCALGVVGAVERGDCLLHLRMGMSGIDAAAVSGREVSGCRRGGGREAETGY